MAESQPKPGEARCPGISVQDLMDRDSRAVPAYLREHSYAFLGDEDIPFARYTSHDWFDEEIEQMWPRTWQWACREEHLPAPGDYYVYDVGPYSVIVVRTGGGEIRAYRNACMHRGTKLKPSFSTGSTEVIRCPYHGWQWDLEGNLESFACEWDFPHVDPGTMGLSPVRAELWGGFVFINLDPDAVPLAEYLQPLPEHVDSSVFEQRYVAIHIQKELNCNWKIASEAFLEAYHVMETHPQLMRTNGDANTQYDFYGDHVNRLINVAGSPSTLLQEPITEQEVLDLFLVGDREDVGDALVVPEGGTARQVMAEHFRQSVAATGGPNLSEVCDSEIVDTIAYFVFPNQQFFSGVSFPIVYRFRPLGMSHDRSLFDFVILKTRPDDGSPAPTAEPVRLTADESYTLVPGMDPYVGHVFDQDTGNVQAAQEGAMATDKAGATLGNYQEIRIRHFHQTLGKYVAGEL
jgi:phenylpropionate dioxygenase-like ring-hydroxylating dioxygenase large terminal subunit